MQTSILTVSPVACLVQDALFVLLDDQRLEAGIIDKRSASCRITVLEDKAKFSFCLGQTEAPEIEFRVPNEITLVAGKGSRNRRIGILL